MRLDLTNLRDAVLASTQTVQVSLDAENDSRLSDPEKNAIKAGVIQHFEFTYELCWKFMKRWLAGPGGRTDLDSVTRKELFRIAAQAGLVADVSSWFQFHVSRNLTSHTYDRTIADEVYKVAVTFPPAAALLLKELERRGHD